MNTQAATLVRRRDNFNVSVALLISLAMMSGCGGHGTEPISPPPPSYLAASTITSSDDSLVADGSTTATIRVELKDSVGRSPRRSAGALVIQASVGSISSVLDHNDGTYSATFTSPKTIGIATI